MDVPLRLSDGREIAVAFVRHPRARRIKLSVDERGARLSVPARAGERAALAFLHAQREWLEAQLARLEDDTAFAFRIGVARALPLRGDALPLRWRSARLTRIVADADDACFEVRGLDALAGQPPTPAVQRALRDFYEARARADIARWQPRHLAGLPRSPARIALKRMSSQWGSLSGRGTMALDLSLVLARPAAFEYVLVHELCHLLHADHSPAFWAAVESRFPGWRDERAWLNAEGRRIKATMRALTG